MLVPDTYEPLTLESLSARMVKVKAVTSRIGDDHLQWQVREVGDGNLNLVFIVEGTEGSVVIKQALPYVRLVGDSWPLPLYRAYFENLALTRQAQRAPRCVPDVYYFDDAQAIIVMQFLSPHIILRNKLIKGETVEGIGRFMGEFCARTAFRGSELSMSSMDKKTDVGLFSGNIEIPAITESLVFTDPYFAAELNNHNELLSPVVDLLRNNVELKRRVQTMLMKFASNTETMLHGDLHSGSIMATDTECYVIDPEFAQYGPMGFDLGMLIANYLMAYFSQPAHRNTSDLNDYQNWILDVITETLTTFEAEFTRLWQEERTGMLFPAALFEAQGHDSSEACTQLLKHIRCDAWAFCGIEMHRRCLSLAHNADFEDIENPAKRAPLEARNLHMGMHLILEAENIADVQALAGIARDYNQRDFL